MTDLPDISVQVPVRDPGAAFAAFLGSLSTQDLRGTTYELIVVDDGSRVPVAESFDLPPDGCAGVVLVRLEGAGNRPRARNAALEASTAPVALMTDADLRLAPDILRRHASFHGDQPGRNVLRGSRMNAWASTATPWQRWFDTRAGGLEGPLSPMPWRHFVTGNASVPRALAIEAGGFDETITHYGGEDTEFAWRLSLSGAAFFRDPTLLADHLDDVDVRRHSQKMHEYGATGLRYTVGRHPEINGLLGTRWIEGRRKGVRTAAVRTLVRASISDPVYRTILWWMERTGRPSFLFTYLSVGACLRGFEGRKP